MIFMSEFNLLVDYDGDENGMEWHGMALAMTMAMTIVDRGLWLVTTLFEYTALCPSLCKATTKWIAWNE